MNEQEKREKVIKGLECCSSQDRRVVFCHEYDCPYRDYEECPENLMRDALALLKAQEQEVINCKDCIHYDKKHTINGFAKCRNSLSPQYCSWLSETNGCDYIERR